MKESVIIVAADARFFPLLSGLLLSIRSRAQPTQPEIVLLDIGLTRDQLRTIENMVTRVIDPPWDFVDETSAPSWFKAMTVRPHLPAYVPGYEVYVSIDCDAWVQSWECVERLIAVAKTGTLAIVEEVYGEEISFFVPSEKGPRLVTCSAEQVQRNVRQCYERGFGPEVARWLGDVPSFNAGVFALSANSTTWQIWHDYMAQGIARGGVHKLIDQQALNLAIRRNEISVTKLPTTYNYVCTHGLPAFDPDRLLFISPRDGAVIGILHLADVKFAGNVPVRSIPNGEIVHLPLHYLDFLFSTPMFRQRISNT